MSVNNYKPDPLIIGNLAEPNTLTDIELGFCPLVDDSIINGQFNYCDFIEKYCSIGYNQLRVAVYSGGKWEKKRGTDVGHFGNGYAPIKAIKIGLEGPIATYYKVQYSVYITGYGWDRGHTDWNDTAGSIAKPVNIQAIYVRFAPRYGYVPGVNC